MQGGTAPARAFADFMRVAVANRPVQKFETDVPLPDWQLEPDEEVWGLPYEEGNGPPLVDENGNPIGPQPGDPLAPPSGAQGPGGPDQSELDRIFNSPAPSRQPQPPQREPQRPPPPRSEPAPDPLEPRSDQPQG